MKKIIFLVLVLNSCAESKKDDQDSNRHTNMKTIIETKNAPSPIGPYSQAVLTGNTLYVSGQIAIDPAMGNVDTADREKETHQVMKNIGAILKEAGMDHSNIVKTSIFLKDMNDFATVNAIYATYFKSDLPAGQAGFPARETVQVSRLPKDVNVEISVIAVK
jgi:2-iminobutanoate/2-iminopropanoate deaminase